MSNLDTVGTVGRLGRLEDRVMPGRSGVSTEYTARRIVVLPIGLGLDASTWEFET